MNTAYDRVKVKTGDYLLDRTFAQIMRLVDIPCALACWRTWTDFPVNDVMPKMAVMYFEVGISIWFESLTGLM